MYYKRNKNTQKYTIIYLTCQQVLSRVKNLVQNQKRLDFIPDHKNPKKISLSGFDQRLLKKFSCKKYHIINNNTI